MFPGWFRPLRLLRRERGGAGLRAYRGAGGGRGRGRGAGHGRGGRRAAGRAPAGDRRGGGQEAVLRMRPGGGGGRGRGEGAHVRAEGVQRQTEEIRRVAKICRY